MKTPATKSSLHKRTVLLTTAYLPNIQYFSKLLTHAEPIIEVWDTYQKQSYRNRAVIYGANGKQDLVIPVKKPHGNHTKTRDVLLDYDMPWNLVHWKAITSAYKHSPFFGIFEPELAPVYGKRIKYLFDWNLLLLEILLQMTGTTLSLSTSKEYSNDPGKDVLDFRASIHPKERMQKPDPAFTPFPYFQVFSNQHGFIAHLSFIDLLFNEGPQAVFLCKQSAGKIPG